MKVGTDGVLLGAWAEATGATRTLDIGTGTGLIALMIAQRNPATNVDAVEIDKPSFDEATPNISSSKWANRIRLANDTIQNFCKTTTFNYDLVITNPPFFAAGTPAPQKNRHQARHTTELSPNDLLEAVDNVLAPQGRFCIILPVTESDKFVQLGLSYDLFVSRKMTFYPKESKPPERHLLEFQRTICSSVKTSSLIQYEEDGSWSTAYKELTKDFYIKL